MSVNVESIAITSIEKITIFDENDEYIGTLDDLTGATMTQDLEKVDIVGSKGAKLMQMKRNKSVTGQASNGTFNLAVAAADLGTEVKRNQTVTFRWKEILPVSNDEATLSYTPAGDAGAEIFGLYLIDNKGVCVKKFKQVTTTPATGEFRLTGKTINFFAGDIVGGTTDSGKIAVWYDRTLTNATVVSNLSDTVAKNVHMVIDCLAESKECDVYYVQIDVPKASLSGNFDIGGGDTQTMYNISWEALASKCDGATGKFWDYIVVDDEIVKAAEGSGT